MGREHKISISGSLEPGISTRLLQASLLVPGYPPRLKDVTELLRLRKKLEPVCDPFKKWFGVVEQIPRVEVDRSGRHVRGDFIHAALYVIDTATDKAESIGFEGYIPANPFEGFNFFKTLGAGITVPMIPNICLDFKQSDKTGQAVLRKGEIGIIPVQEVADTWRGTLSVRAADTYDRKVYYISFAFDREMSDALWSDYLELCAGQSRTAATRPDTRRFDVPDVIKKFGPSTTRLPFCEVSSLFKASYDVRLADLRYKLTV